MLSHPYQYNNNNSNTATTTATTTITFKREPYQEEEEEHDDHQEDHKDPQINDNDDTYDEHDDGDGGGAEYESLLSDNDDIVVGGSTKYKPRLRNSSSDEAQRRDDATSQLQTHYNFKELRNEYVVLKLIGEGAFSKVYHCVNALNPKEQYALKRLVKTYDVKRTMNEIIHLRRLGGNEENNVITIYRIFRHGDRISLLLPYFPHEKFHHYMTTMDTRAIREYMRNLFIAIAHIHSHNVIHRDIKPNNFLYSKTLKRYLLVDFGLAETYVKEDAPSSRYGSSSFTIDISRGASVFQKQNMHAERAGTRGFRAPEVLMKVKHQTPAIDMWSAGVILLCILSHRFPFFHSPDDMTGLAEIYHVFGHERLSEAAKACGRGICTHFCGNESACKGFDLRELCEKLRGPEKRNIYDDEDNLYDLLNQLLQLDPAKRITASEALKHPFIAGEYPSVSAKPKNNE